MFDRIYIENKAENYDLTKKVVSCFPKSELTYINHYKDVFDVGGQDFCAQKQAPSLILAVNDGRKIYPGARPCQDFGHEHFHYTSQVKNCVYDCDYCFLRGMYPSGNIVIFVNYEDYFAEIDELLKSHPVYLSIAYDTDLLAFEGFTGLVEKWVAYAASRKDLLIELRTKCSSQKVVSIIKRYGCRNVILAITLSPDNFTKKFEHGTGSFSARLALATAALSEGIRTRLCFDPVFPVKDFEAVYGDMIDQVFANDLLKQVEDISVGTFRISSGYLKRMRRTALSPLTAYPYEIKEGMATFDDATLKIMFDFMGKKLAEYIDPAKVFVQ